MKKLLTLALTFLAPLAQASGATDPLQPVYDFIRQQPGDVALEVRSVAPDGTQKKLLSHNAAQPMPLASSMKIVVLAAYARAVAAGTLRPDQTVTLSEWESFYVLLDGGAHAASLKALNIPADAYGRAQDPQQKVTLDTLARFMIETSDNAATDALLFRLGEKAVSDTIRALGLKGQGDIGPLAGIFTAWDREGAAYLKLSPAEQRARDWQWAQKVRTTPALRHPPTILARAYRSDRRLAPQLQNQTPPLGTPADYSALLGRVLSGEGFGAAELAVLRRHLGWPMRVNPKNAQFFNAVYAKGGSLGAGVLTNNFALEFKNGNRFVYSIFFRNLPANAYGKVSSQLDNFILTTLTDPAAQKKLLEALNSR